MSSKAFHEIGLPAVEDALRELKRDLDDIGARVFLMAGTLLGAVREGHLLPHDKDVDLGVTDEAELRKIYDALHTKYEGAWFVGEDVPAGLILFLARRVNGELIPFELQCHYPHKHLVFYNREMDKTWTCYETHVAYPARLYQEFTKLAFLGEQWDVPKPPEAWLEAFYGPDWREPKVYSDWRYNCPLFLSGYLSERHLEP